MGIKKKAKQLVNFSGFLLAMSKLTEGKCYKAGGDLFSPTDKFCDKLFGNHNSEIALARLILKMRAFEKGFEDAAMKNFGQKQKDILNQYKKEI